MVQAPLLLLDVMTLDLQCLLFLPLVFQISCLWLWLESIISGYGHAEFPVGIVHLNLQDIQILDFVWVCLQLLYQVSLRRLVLGLLQAGVPMLFDGRLLFKWRRFRQKGLQG